MSDLDVIEQDAPPNIPWLSEQIDAMPVELAIVVEMGLLIFVSWIVFYATKNLLRPLLRKLIARTKNQWDDILVCPKFIFYLSWIPVTAIGNYGVIFSIAPPVGFWMLFQTSRAR